MRIAFAVLLILYFSQTINLSVIHKNEIESKKDIQNIINAINTVFKSNITFGSLVDESGFLQQILNVPDEINMNEIIMLLSLKFHEFYLCSEDSKVYTLFVENFQKWLVISQAFKEDGSEAVILENLKPFFVMISKKNSTFAPIVNAINEYLYEDGSDDQSFLDLVLTGPDNINLNEIITILFQNYLLLPFEGVEEKPENYDQIVQLVIQVVTDLQVSSEQVTMRELKPVIRFIWSLLFPSITPNTTPTQASVIKNDSKFSSLESGIIAGSATFILVLIWITAVVILIIWKQEKMPKKGDYETINKNKFEKADYESMNQNESEKVDNEKMNQNESGKADNESMNTNKSNEENDEDTTF